MKKISLILALALVLVGAFAAVAFAADATHPTTNGVYLPVDASGNVLPIHSQYSANSDACAACHSAHNGNGEALLQWDTFNVQGITAACMACHDGTVTATYDVKSGHIAATGARTNAGLFAVQNDGTNASALSASQHGVFGGTKLNDAFGGAMKATAVADANGVWNADFDCASCHSPHGQGGNSRILDPNPNYVMTQGVDPHTKGVGGALLATADGTNAKYYFGSAAVVSGVTTNATGAVIKDGTVLGQTPILGYPYGVTAYVDGVKDSKAKVSFDAIAQQGDTPKVYVLLSKVPATGAKITVDYTPALKVSFTVANKLQAAEKVTYNSGLNQFCGACHTDYNTAQYKDASGNFTIDPTADLNGQYSSHTRHKVGYAYSAAAARPQLTFEGGNQVTCLTCHYAHGVDQNVWAATATRVGIAAYNNPESAGSSKLKRLPNMGTCESCHQKELGNYSVNNSF